MNVASFLLMKWSSRQSFLNQSSPFSCQVFRLFSYLYCLVPHSQNWQPTWPSPRVRGSCSILLKPRGVIVSPGSPITLFISFLGNSVWRNRTGWRSADNLVQKKNRNEGLPSSLGILQNDDIPPPQHKVPLVVDPVVCGAGLGVTHMDSLELG